MKSSLSLSVAAILALGLLSGCGVTNKLGGERGGWASEDQANVSGAMSEDPEVVEDGLFETADATEAAWTAGLVRGTEGVTELIQPRRFWRQVRSVDRRFEFAFADTDSTGRPTTAIVMIHKQLAGSFNIVADSSGLRDSVRHEPRMIRKPLADQWTRRVLLKRMAHPDSMRDSARSKWRVMASSLARVTSNLPEVPETHIVSVQIQSGGRDTTISDPLAMFWRHRLPWVTPGAIVRVTVRTERADDVVALVHRDRRFFLHPNGDNTYTGEWAAPLEMGVRHIGINALAHGALYDDAAPYSSDAWLWAYGVRNAETVASNMP